MKLKEYIRKIIKEVVEDNKEKVSIKDTSKEESEYKTLPIEKIIKIDVNGDYEDNTDTIHNRKTWLLKNNKDFVLVNPIDDVSLTQNENIVLDYGDNNHYGSVWVYVGILPNINLLSSMLNNQNEIQNDNLDLIIIKQSTEK